LDEVLERSSDAELLLVGAASGQIAVSSGQELLPLSQSRSAERLLRRLGDCDLARGEGKGVVLKRRRAELLRHMLS
jgi:hypothetical protein